MAFAYGNYHKAVISDKLYHHFLHNLVPDFTSKMIIFKSFDKSFVYISRCSSEECCTATSYFFNAIRHIFTEHTSFLRIISVVEHQTFFTILF